MNLPWKGLRQKMARRREVMKFFGIITDCVDSEATLRQQVMGQQVHGILPSIAHIRSGIAAAGHLISTVDVGRADRQCAQREGYIIVNYAPRKEDDENANGSPFGYVRIGRTHVLSTLGDCELSLVHQLDLASVVQVVDLDATALWAWKKGLIDSSEKAFIMEGQFRSLYFAQPALGWLKDNRDLRQQVTRVHLISDFAPAVPPCVWHVDDFGNCKTTMLDPAEISRTRFSHLPFSKRLALAPDDHTPVWVVGSSGLRDKRFLELVVKNGRASDVLDLKIGSLL
jgi:hypothetical protein